MPPAGHTLLVTTADSVGVLSQITQELDDVGLILGEHRLQS